MEEVKAVTEGKGSEEVDRIGRDLTKLVKTVKELQRQVESQRIEMHDKLE